MRSRDIAFYLNLTRNIKHSRSLKYLHLYQTLWLFLSASSMLELLNKNNLIEKQQTGYFIALNNIFFLLKDSVIPANIVSEQLRNIPCLIKAE